MPIDIAKLTATDSPEGREAEAATFAASFISAGVVRPRPLAPSRTLALF